MKRGGNGEIVKESPDEEGRTRVRGWEIEKEDIIYNIYDTFRAQKVKNIAFPFPKNTFLYLFINLTRFNHKH